MFERDGMSATSCRCHPIMLICTGLYTQTPQGSSRHTLVLQKIALFWWRTLPQIFCFLLPVVSLNRSHHDYTDYECLQYNSSSMMFLYFCFPFTTMMQIAKHHNEDAHKIGNALVNLNHQKLHGISLQPLEKRHSGFVLIQALSYVQSEINIRTTPTKNRKITHYRDKSKLLKFQMKI